MLCSNVQLFFNLKDGEHSILNKAEDLSIKKTGNAQQFPLRADD